MDKALQEIDRYLSSEKDAQCGVVSLNSLQLDSIPCSLLSWPEGTLLTELNLDSNFLEELPSAFGESMVCLVELSLSENRLASLPDSLRCLQNLKVLSLDGNQFVDVPSCIFGLVGLEKLSLRENGLTTLSGEWSELKCLKSLHADRNKLEELPDSLCQLTNLHVLDVSMNYLSTLPEKIGDLLLLEVLIVHRCLLESLPGTFSNFENLSTLDISCNMLTSVPDTLRCSTKLERVGLNDNCLMALPEWLNDLLVVEELDFSNNRLTGSFLSETCLHHCTKLRRINACRNTLDTLPDSLGVLENLEVFQLGGIGGTYGGGCGTGNCIARLPDSFCDLNQLREFSACENLLCGLPEAIGQLRSLSVLDLTGNYLQNLPESFCNLESLTTLNLSYNLLHCVPSGIDRLSKLSCLQLNFNCLTDLPSTLVKLSSLQLLGLAGNKIVHFPVFLNELKQLQSVSLAGNPNVKFLPQDLAETIRAAERKHDRRVLYNGWRSKWMDAQQKLVDNVVDRLPQARVLLGISALLHDALISGCAADTSDQQIVDLSSHEDWDEDVESWTIDEHCQPTRTFVRAPSHAGSYTWCWQCSSDGTKCDDSEWEPPPDVWTNACLPRAKRKEVKAAPLLYETVDEWMSMFT